MAGSDGRQSLPQFSKAQLAQLFGLHRNTVSARLRNAVPDGYTHKTNATYCLPTVAHLLIDADSLMASSPALGPDDMPPDMAKDYWDAQLKEQQFRQRDGELWRDAEVLDVFAAVFKPLANKVRSISDAVERRAALTPKQVIAVQDACDGALREMYDEVKKVVGGIALDAEPADP
ncbi:MAG: DUF1441 family protein [Hyphomicrobiaceae bacterium]